MTRSAPDEAAPAEPTAAEERGGSDRNALAPLPLAVVCVALRRAAEEAVGAPAPLAAPPPCSDVSRSIVKSARRPLASTATPAPAAKDGACDEPVFRSGDAMLCIPYTRMQTS